MFPVWLPVWLGNWAVTGWSNSNLPGKECLHKSSLLICAGKINDCLQSLRFIFMPTADLRSAPAKAE